MDEFTRDIIKCAKRAKLIDHNEAIYKICDVVGLQEFLMQVQKEIAQIPQIADIALSTLPQFDNLPMFCRPDNLYDEYPNLQPSGSKKDNLSSTYFKYPRSIKDH